MTRPAPDRAGPQDAGAGAARRACSGTLALMDASTRWAAVLTPLREQRRDLEPVIGHLVDALGDVPPEPRLVAVTSDLCAAGHVHLDVILWAIDEHDLVLVDVAEEHYEPDGPESEVVETTFRVMATRYPFRSIAGVQHGVELRPDGTLVQSELQVLVRGQLSLHGRALPAVCDDPDCDADHGLDLDLHPAQLSFVGQPADLDPVRAFAAALRGRLAATT